jgi:hypothetical protein
MRSLIVKLHTFKADNEKIKKPQEEQHEVNEILLWNIVEKRKSKKTKANKETRKQSFEK